MYFLTPPAMYQLVGDTLQFVSSPRSGLGNCTVSIYAAPWMFHIMLVTRLWLMWFTGNELNVWPFSITPLLTFTTTMWPLKENTHTLVYSLLLFSILVTLLNFIMRMIEVEILLWKKSFSGQHIVSFIALHKWNRKHLLIWNLVIVTGNIWIWQ